MIEAETLNVVKALGACRNYSDTVDFSSTYMRLVVLSLSMMNHGDLWEGHDNVHIRTTTESLVFTR
jgi:hypothetical protein